MKIEKIKMKWYSDANTIEGCKKAGYFLQLLKRKPVLSGINDNRYYTDEITAITIEESDKKKILEKIGDNRPGGYIIVADIMKYISGSMNMAKEEYAFCTERYKRVWYIGEHGFCLPDDTSIIGGKKTASTYTFYVAEIDTLKPLPLTKREETKLQLLKEKEARCRLNAVTISNTLLNILNENGYEIGNTGNQGLYFTKIKGYNKLMKDAIEYYLNNKIFKDMNIIVCVPKVKNQHKYGYNDNLLEFGDIEIKES